MDIGHGRIKWVISCFMFVQLFRWYYLVCFPAPTPPIEKINSSSNNNNVRFNAIIPASWGWQFFALIWVRHLSRSSAYSCFNPNSAKSIFTYSFLDFVGRPFSLFQPISSSMALRIWESVSRCMIWSYHLCSTRDFLDELFPLPFNIKLHDFTILRIGFLTNDITIPSLTVMY